MHARPTLVLHAVADEVALAIRGPKNASAASRCDACGVRLQDDEGGAGLLLWHRGDGEFAVDEPPLCSGCSTAIGVTALAHWNTLEEEG